MATNVSTISTRSQNTRVEIPAVDAVAFDEDPPEPLNSDNGPARQMMEMIEDNSQAIGSQLYVNLANICGDFAKLERQNARMRAKLIEYDGESCSAFIPSDDNGVDAEDYQSDADEEDQEEESSGSSVCDPSFEGGACIGRRVHGSCLSTCSSQMGALPAFFRAQPGAAEVQQAPSGKYIKYSNEYYAIPPEAIKRQANSVEVESIADLRSLTTRGERAKTWHEKFILTGKLDWKNIWIIEMKHRDPEFVQRHGTHTEFFWACTLKLGNVDTNGHPPSDDHFIVHLLPETTVHQLHTRMEQDPVLKQSRLCSVWKPKFLDEPWFCMCDPVRSVPIPGPSRTKGPADVARWQIEAGDVVVGNYWTSMRTVKRVRSYTDPVWSNRKRRTIDPSDDEDEE